MFLFLKKLRGQDDEARRVQERFNTSLSDAASHGKKLNDAGAAIVAIIRDVDRKNSKIALSSATSGLSGEHALGVLPPLPSEIEEDHG